MSSSVWVGFDQPKSIKEYGIKAALPIWLDFMEKSLKGKKSAKLDMPEGVVKASFNVETGELATEVFDIVKQSISLKIF